MYIIIYHIIFQMNIQACKCIVCNEYGCFTDMYTVQCTVYIVQCIYQIFVIYIHPSAIKNIFNDILFT